MQMTHRINSHVSLLPCLLLSLTAAIELTPTVSQPATEPQQYALSTSAPLTSALSANPELGAQLASVFDLIDNLSHVIDHRVSTNHTQACNLHAEAWPEAAAKHAEHLQIGRVSRECASRVDGSEIVARGELEAAQLTSAQQTLHDGAMAAGAAAQRLVTDAHALAWKAAVPMTGWDVRRGAQVCRVETAAAVRVNGTWYMRVAATNAAVDAFLPDGDRFYVEEFVSRALNGPLGMVLPGLGDGNGTRHATTVMRRSGGKAAFSAVRRGRGRNAALVEALRLNALAVDQAEDAVTASNVAILALPMVLSVVPVGFVADMNTWGTLAYIVVTDVLTTLPFLIKGIEVVTTGALTSGEVVTYHAGTAELGVLETWGAECRGKDGFRRLGAAFISVAVAMMALGFALEVYAWRSMRRRRAAEGRHAAGPLGELIRLHPYSMFGPTLQDTLHPQDAERVWTDRQRRRWRIRRKTRRSGRGGDDGDDGETEVTDARAAKH